MLCLQARESQPALCISFSPGQGKSDLVPVLLSRSERCARNCMRSKQQQRRGSGYLTPWGCNTNRDVNICVPTFLCAFFLCVFSYSPSLSCLSSQAGCSCLSPCHGTRWHRHVGASSGSTDKGCRSHTDNYVWCWKEEQHNNWHPAPLCPPAAARIPGTKEHPGNAGLVKNHLSVGRKAGQTSVCFCALAELFSWALSHGMELIHIHTHI